VLTVKSQERVGASVYPDIHGGWWGVPGGARASQTMLGEHSERERACSVRRGICSASVQTYGG